VSWTIDLSDKVALVTGGNGGIGLGIATALANAGARVIITGRNNEKTEAALAKVGKGAVGRYLDVSSEDSCQTLFREIEQDFGRLDILVNNAGLNVRARPEDLSSEGWHKVMDANVFGPFICSKLAYPLMKRSGGGKIILIASMATMFGSPVTPAYAASKAAIVLLGRSLTTAWAKDNIQINSILPGSIDTDLTRAARRDIPGMHERVLQRTPAGRWGNPEDLGGLAVFLSSRESDFINGASITVDGGFSAQF
jgi:2-deoxy-D-gluconate 3-dehydrogenase